MAGYLNFCGKVESRIGQKWPAANPQSALEWKHRSPDIPPYESILPMPVKSQELEKIHPDVIINHKLIAVAITPDVVRDSAPMQTRLKRAAKCVYGDIETVCGV
jgi:hypothetical protein